MKMYRVMKKNRAVGHFKLPYGETVTAKQVGVTEDVLDTYVSGGILKVVPAVAPAKPSKAEAAKEG